MKDGQLRAAVELMMREYGKVVYSVANRILGNPALAKDALQQTFLEALRDASGYQGRSSVRTWLLGIASNRAIDLARRQRREEQWNLPDDGVEQISEVSAPEIPAALDDRRLQRALEECLSEVSPETRVALLLRFQQGLSYEQISKICKEKPGTLQARVKRAMPVLRRCLEGKGWGQ